MFLRAMQTMVALVYPPRCLSCGGLVETDFGLCGDCWRDTPFIAGLACDLCGTPLPGQSDEAEHCDDCLTTPRPWSHGRAALVYKDKARKLVLGLKHGDRHDIAGPASDWMARKLSDIVPKDALAIPVPLHLHRHLHRRYNQSALLAEGIAHQMGIDWCPDVLERRHATPSLDGRSKEDRFATLGGAISVNPLRAPMLGGRPILLVDDVMTSGATLTACAEACLAEDASEICVSVLARVTKDA